MIGRIHHRRRVLAWHAIELAAGAGAFLATYYVPSALGPHFPEATASRRRVARGGGPGPGGGAGESGRGAPGGGVWKVGGHPGQAARGGGRARGVTIAEGGVGLRREAAGGEVAAHRVAFDATMA